MKKITICLSCYDVYCNGTYVSSIKEIAKLLLISSFDTTKLDIVRHICPECYTSLPKEYLEKIKEKYLEKKLEQTSS